MLTKLLEKFVQLNEKPKERVQRAIDERNMHIAKRVAAVITVLELILCFATFLFVDPSYKNYWISILYIFFADCKMKLHT